MSMFFTIIFILIFFAVLSRLVDSYYLRLEAQRPREKDFDRIDEHARRLVDLPADAVLAPAAILKLSWKLNSRLSAELGTFIQYFVRDYIANWFSLSKNGEGISEDPTFLDLVRYQLTNVVGSLAYRISNVKPLKFLVEDILEVLRIHISWYAEMERRAAEADPTLFIDLSDAELLHRANIRLGIVSSSAPAPTVAQVVTTPATLMVGGSTISGVAPQIEYTKVERSRIAEEQRIIDELRERAILAQYSLEPDVLHPACDVKSAQVLCAFPSVESFAPTESVVLTPKFPPTRATLVQHAYLRPVCAQLVTRLLPANESNALIQGMFLRESMVTSLFAPLINSFDSHYFNCWAIDLCHENAPSLEGKQHSQKEKERLDTDVLETTPSNRSVSREVKVFKLTDCPHPILAYPFDLDLTYPPRNVLLSSQIDEISKFHHRSVNLALKNYPEISTKFAQEPALRYFWGCLSRAEAVTILDGLPHGTFLLRSVPASAGGFMVLSFVKSASSDSEGVGHARIDCELHRKVVDSSPSPGGFTSATDSPMASTQNFEYSTTWSLLGEQSFSLSHLLCLCSDIARIGVVGGSPSPAPVLEAIVSPATALSSLHKVLERRGFHASSLPESFFTLPVLFADPAGLFFGAEQSAVFSPDKLAELSSPSTTSQSNGPLISSNNGNSTNSVAANLNVAVSAISNSTGSTGTSEDTGFALAHALETVAHTPSQLDFLRNIEFIKSRPAEFGSVTPLLCTDMTVDSSVSSVVPEVNSERQHPSGSKRVFSKESHFDSPRTAGHLPSASAIVFAAVSPTSPVTPARTAVRSQNSPDWNHSHEVEVAASSSSSSHIPVSNQQNNNGTAGRRHRAHLLAATTGVKEGLAFSREPRLELTGNDTPAAVMAPNQIYKDGRRTPYPLATLRVSTATGIFGDLGIVGAGEDGASELSQNSSRIATSEDISLPEASATVASDRILPVYPKSAPLTRDTVALIVGSLPSVEAFPTAKEVARRHTENKRFSGVGVGPSVISTPSKHAHSSSGGRKTSFSIGKALVGLLDIGNDDAAGKDREPSDSHRGDGIFVLDGGSASATGSDSESDSDSSAGLRGVAQFLKKVSILDKDKDGEKSKKSRRKRLFFPAPLSPVGPPSAGLTSPRGGFSSIGPGMTIPVPLHAAVVAARVRIDSNAANSFESAAIVVYRVRVHTTVTLAPSPTGSTEPLNVTSPPASDHVNLKVDSKDLSTGEGVVVMWSIHARYSAFFQLHEALDGALGKLYSSSTAPFPPKDRLKVSKHYEKEYIETRRSGLDAWLKSVLSNPLLTGTREVRQFLRPNKVKLLTESEFVRETRQDLSSGKNTPGFTALSGSAGAVGSVSAGVGLNGAAVSAGSSAAAAARVDLSVAERGSAERALIDRELDELAALDQDAARLDETYAGTAGSSTARDVLSATQPVSDGMDLLTSHIISSSLPKDITPASVVVSGSAPGASVFSNFSSTRGLPEYQLPAAPSPLLRDDVDKKFATSMNPPILSSSGIIGHGVSSSIFSYLTPPQLRAAEHRLFAVVYSIFSIQRFNWMKRQFLGMIRQALKIIYQAGSGEHLSTFHKRYFSEEAIYVRVRDLIRGLWPGGVRAPPSVTPSWFIQQRARRLSLIGLVDISDGALASVIGRESSEMGMRRLHGILQLPVVLRSIVHASLDLLLAATFPGIKVFGLPKAPPDADVDAKDMLDVLQNNFAKINIENIAKFANKSVALVKGGLSNIIDRDKDKDKDKEKFI